MTQRELVKRLSELVQVHGAARVAAELNYRSDRSISVWISTKKIPRARMELVSRLIKTGIA